LDNTIKGPEDIERLAHLPSLGVIPFFSLKGRRKKRGMGITPAPNILMKRKIRKKRNGFRYR